MKIKIYKVVLFGILLVTCLWPLGVAKADNPDTAGIDKKTVVNQAKTQMDALAGKAQFGEAVPIQYTAARIIQLILSFVGIIFTVLIVYAGYLRFTAHGEQSRIESSNKTLLAAVIGVAIVMTAYGVTRLITERVQFAVQENAELPAEYK